MISHIDLNIIERGLEMIHAFFKSIEDLDDKIAEFMINIFPIIFRLSADDSPHIEEIASNLKDVIYRSFDQKILDLINPCKDEIMKYLIKVFSEDDFALSNFVFNELGNIVKNCVESCPVTTMISPLFVKN